MEYINMDEQLAIELTRKYLLNGQDEKPKEFGSSAVGAYVILSDNRILYFNRVQVKHAEIMLANRKEER